jgi:hypothetical protein
MYHGFNADVENGSVASELAADAYPCIMVRVFGPAAYKDVARFFVQPARSSPSSNLVSAARAGKRRVIGVGLKDYESTQRRVPNKAFREYLNTMAALVSWLQESGYDVRLLIGDIQYNIWVIKEFVELLKSRNIPTDAPLLIAEPALTVTQLLRQVGETNSHRYIPPPRRC